MADHTWEADIIRRGELLALECEGEFCDGAGAFVSLVARDAATGELVELTEREEEIVDAHGWWTFGHDVGMRDALYLLSRCPECHRPGDAAFSRCCSRNCEAAHYTRCGGSQVAA